METLIQDSEKQLFYNVFGRVISAYLMFLHFTSIRMCVCVCALPVREFIWCFEFPS